MIGLFVKPGRGSSERRMMGGTRREGAEAPLS
jgi:hypothetical protein